MENNSISCYNFNNILECSCKKIEKDKVTIEVMSNLELKSNLGQASLHAKNMKNHSLEVVNLPSVSIDGSTNVSAQSECANTYGMAMDVFAGYTEIAERDSEHVKEIGYQLSQLDLTMAGILKNLQE